MSEEYVPFNVPYVTGEEFEYIAVAIANGHLSGNGPFSERCAGWLERRTGAHAALLTHSCTAALEIAGLLAEVEPGDEVVMPSYTFVSTANAFVLRGAVPVFVDVRPDTANLDERLVEDAIGPRTRALVAVHYAGVGAEMDPLMDIADRHGLMLIEDAAQGAMASYRGRSLGGIGHVGALSFHETKNVMSGEGGALLVNDERWVDRARVLQDKGTNRAQFFAGRVEKYTWQDIGSSYAPSEINAAFLWAQLEAAEQITAARLAEWGRYHQRLSALESAGMLRRPIVPAHCRHNAHMYYVLLAEGLDRGEVLHGLRARGADAVFHYVPLHSSPAGQRHCRVHGALEQTERFGSRLIRLPLWVGMGEAAVEKVVDALEATLAVAAAR